MSNTNQVPELFYGSQEGYNNKTSKEQHQIHFTSDTHKIYVGDQDFSNPLEIVKTSDPYIVLDNETVELEIQNMDGSCYVELPSGATIHCEGYPEGSGSNNIYQFPEWLEVKFEHTADSTYNPSHWGPGVKVYSEHPYVITASRPTHTPTNTFVNARDELTSKKANKIGGSYYIFGPYDSLELANRDPNNRVIDFTVTQDGSKIKIDYAGTFANLEIHTPEGEFLELDPYNYGTYFSGSFVFPDDFHEWSVSGWSSDEPLVAGQRFTFAFTDDPVLSALVTAPEKDLSDVYATAIDKIKSVEKKLPTSLPNPNSLTIKRGTTTLGTYDGSETESIDILNKTLTIKGGGLTGNQTYNGASAKTITLPNNLPNPNKLIITQDGTTLGEYDGSEALTIDIPKSSEADSNHVNIIGPYETYGEASSDSHQSFSYTLTDDNEKIFINNYGNYVDIYIDGEVVAGETYDGDNISRYFDSNYLVSPVGGSGIGAEQGYVFPDAIMAHYPSLENRWKAGRTITFTARDDCFVYVYAFKEGQNIEVDSELSTTSTNPVQNKVVTESLEKKISYPENYTNSSKVPFTITYVNDETGDESSETYQLVAVE